MKAYISELIGQAVQAISPEEAEVVLGSSVFDVSYPKSGFGDYATNAAMVLFKKFNVAPAANPMEFARSLAEQVQKLDHNDTFAKIESVSGFINFTLAQNVLAHQVAGMQNNIEFTTVEGTVGQGKKVVFEYSSPNTNKALHIGHVRNDVYGKACINLLKAVGYDVVSCEIINDRGIHIMKSILMYQKYGNEQTPESAGLKSDHFVGKFYSMFGEKASESEQAEHVLLEEAQELLRRWEDNDAEIRAVWEKMNEWFFEGVKQTYAREGSTFDEQDFESNIYDKGRELVLSGVEKGVFQKEVDGSVSVDLENEKLGKKYLLRKDGTTLYMTQDMYLWDQRNGRHKPDMAFVTTSVEQSYHFQVLQHVFRLLDYPWANNFKHLPYEHVYLGKSKMSSRAGTAISADELYDSVKQRVRDTMATLERLKGSAEDEVLVEAVAMGAVKYGYLHFEPQTRIYFDIESTIALEGNTGPYIQYAYARIQSILRKVGATSTAEPVGLTAPEELQLMRTLIRYESAVSAAAREYKPNLLCNFLLELASAMNTFYGNVSVVKEEDEAIKEQRISLLISTANVLKNGLELLGIAAPQEM
jgi:arginyl-tRNA synthetase